jgi:hypothetical protein
MNKKILYLLLALIIITGLLLSYVLYSGPFYAFDDLSYIIFSHQILNGTFSPVQSPYAYGFLLPVSIATSFAIFGLNTFASILPSLLEYVAIILISSAIARKLYGTNTGLVCAFLVATAPFVVGYSTRVLPDMGVGMMVGLSMLFLVYAQGSKNSKLFYFLSGAFAVLTIYVKLIGLAYIFAFFIALLIYRFYDKKKSSHKGANDILIYSLAGMFVVGVIYISIMFGFSGSIFGSFISYGKNQMAISPSSLSKNFDALFTTFFGYNGFGTALNPQVFPLGLIIFVALAGTLIGLIRKEKNIICLSVILWIAFLYLFFGTVTISKYSFIYVVSRYFIMVSVPIAVIASYALLSICKLSKPILKNNSIYLPALILLIVVISYIPIYKTLYDYNSSISENTRSFSSTLSYIKTQSQGNNLTLVTIDNVSSDFLEFLSSYNKNINVYTLNTSSKTKITMQLNRICTPQAVNTYIIIAYDNYSRLASTTIFNDWINTSCSLVKLNSFNDNKSGGPYNGMDVEINLYKVNYTK